MIKEGADKKSTQIGGAPREDRGLLSWGDTRKKISEPPYSHSQVEIRKELLRSRSADAQSKKS